MISENRFEDRLVEALRRTADDSVPEIRGRPQVHRSAVSRWPRAVLAVGLAALVFLVAAAVLIRREPPSSLSTAAPESRTSPDSGAEDPMPSSGSSATSAPLDDAPSLPLAVGGRSACDDPSAAGASAATLSQGGWIDASMPLSYVVSLPSGGPGACSIVITVSRHLTSAEVEMIASLAGEFRTELVTGDFCEGPLRDC